MRISKYTPEGYIIKDIAPLNILYDMDRTRDGKDMWVKFTEYLKKRLIGKVCSFPVLGKDMNGNSEIHRAGHLYIDDIYKNEDNKIHFIGHGFFSDVNDKIDLILHIGGRSDTNKIYYEDKPDPINLLDPYGEEDWENERLITKFELFENLREDDPYGEEDWDEEYEIGDELICQVDYSVHLGLTTTCIYKKEKKYEIVDMGNNKICMMSDTGKSHWFKNDQRHFRKIPPPFQRNYVPVRRNR